MPPLWKIMAVQIIAYLDRDAVPVNRANFQSAAMGGFGGVVRTHTQTHILTTLLIYRKISLGLRNLVNFSIILFDVSLSNFMIISHTVPKLEAIDGNHL